MITILNNQGQSVEVTQWVYEQLVAASKNDAIETKMIRGRKPAPEIHTIPLNQFKH